MREDTLAGKIFVRRWNDTLDQLVYNDYWQAGDSLLVDNDEIFIRALITGRDSTMIQGVYHHVFYYTAYHDSVVISTSTIIEGIGDVRSHSYLLVYPATMDASFSLLCFFHAGSKPVPVPPAGGFYNTGACIPTAVINRRSGESYRGKLVVL